MEWEVGRRTSAVALVFALLLAPAIAFAGPGLAGTDEATVDEDAAASFVQRSFWNTRGTAVDFPEHVVFPVGSLRIVDALGATGGEDRVDTQAAAEAAARMQQASGGFVPFLRGASALQAPGVRATGAALALAADHDVGMDEGAAETFLWESQNLDGGFGPAWPWNGVPGSFVTPTYYALLGLETLGALDLETKLEIRSFLLQAQNADGGWDNWRFSSTSATTPTYDAVRALDLLGMLDPATKAEVAGFLELVEDPVNGGFHESYEPPTCYLCSDEPPSVPSTGRALLTLALLDPADVTSAIDGRMHAAWLAERQVDSGPRAGGFPLYGTASMSIPHRAHATVGTLVGTDPLPQPFPRTQAAVTDWTRNTALAVAGLQAVGEQDVVDLPEAQAFLAASQHTGTGGFGWLPGFLEEMDATAAAYRALDHLDRIDQAPGAALAASMSAWQADDGSIPQQWWDLAPRLTHTSDAIEALNRTDRLDAVDTDAAAAYIASWQGEDGGFDGPEPWSDLQTTWKAVRALDKLDELDRIDRDALAAHLAALQSEEGNITPVQASDPAATWDTARALRTLAAIDGLDGIDVNASVEYLASWQNDDGSYAYGRYGVPTGAHTVLGLSAVDRRDAIDGDGTRSYLVGGQHDHGGLADRGFPPGPNPMVRHALALGALAELGEL